MVTDGEINGLVEPGEGAAAKMDDAQVKALAGLLAGCVDAYSKWLAEERLSEEERQRRGHWKRSDEDREAFLAVISEKPVLD